MTRNEILFRLALAAVLTPVIKFAPMIFGVEMLWWVAAVIALGIAFLGELIIPD